MIVALVIALGSALCGCQDTGELENQAYVLVLALDRGEDGALAVTARVPKIGKGGGKGEQGDSGGSAYLTFSVTAPSWPKALDALQWATPRRINLSHIEMIVASEALASQPAFPTLMNAVADTPHLYTNARFVICAGSAASFLEAGETVIGARLSSEIHAMLSQYASQGFIPDACLADACYCANGIYGDPIAIWGYAGDGPAQLDGLSAVAASPLRQRFRGAALFKGGRFVKALSPGETRLLNVIRKQGDTLSYGWRDGVVDFSLDAPVRKDVSVEGKDVIISIFMGLKAPGSVSDADAELLEASIREDVIQLIESCQRLDTDPFGFAETASRRFATVPQWTAFDWHSRYPRAALNVEVNIRPLQ